MSTTREEVLKEMGHHGCESRSFLHVTIGTFTASYDAFTAIRAAICGVFAYLMPFHHSASSEHMHIEVITTRAALVILYFRCDHGTIDC